MLFLVRFGLNLGLNNLKFSHMGVRRGGQEGALDPPWPAKIVCFLTFLEENSMLLGVFQANSMFYALML